MELFKNKPFLNLIYQYDPNSQHSDENSALIYVVIPFPKAAFS